MSADEVVDGDRVDLTQVTMGHPVVKIYAATISPMNERPLEQGVEMRRSPDAEFAHLQVGPIRYTVHTQQFVEAVNLAFPFETKQVRDAWRGRFEILTDADTIFEATQRAFATLTKYAAGMIPRRIIGPLDLIATATNTSPEEIAAHGAAFGCEAVIDPLAEVVVIDYGATGYPFSVTVRIAAASPPT